MKMLKMLVVLLVLVLAGSVLAGTEVYYGGTSNDWANGDNWWSGNVPTATQFASVTDAKFGFVGSGDLTIYLGTDAVCGDIGINANSGDGGNQSLTIKSGASLTVGMYNFDLGYVAGTETSTLNVEAGGTLSVAGYFLNWSRPGPQYVNVGGTINALGTFGFNKESGIFIDFIAPTGEIVISGFPEGDLSWYAGNWLPYMLHNGVAYGETGWDLVATWADGKTTFAPAAIPEPATMILLSLGGLTLLRKRS